MVFATEVVVVVGLNKLLLNDVVDSECLLLRLAGKGRTVAKVNLPMEATKLFIIIKFKN